jgi:2-dehydro-3-deoxyphosphogluconate aldolase/(4S)-4-hydroxy-2-oxoglutarate aldolase
MSAPGLPNGGITNALNAAREWRVGKSGAHCWPAHFRLYKQLAHSGAAMSPEDRHAKVVSTMKLAPVIPVLTVRDVADGVAQARALVAGGLLAIEVTLRTPAALEAIKEIAASVPGAHVGAGALFLVSPGASPTLARAAADAPIPFLPGVATPSEAMALRDLGFRALKLFPAEAVGGARLLSSIAAPLPDLVFCPTGGIDMAKAPSYLALANVLCVGGSWMLPRAALDAKDYAKVEQLSREAAALPRGA